MKLVELKSLLEDEAMKLSWPSVGPIEPSEAELADMNRNLNSESEAAISMFAGSRGWPEMTDEVGRLIQLRLQHALKLISVFTMPSSPIGAFNEKASDADLILLFLIESLEQTGPFKELRLRPGA